MVRLVFALALVALPSPALAWGAEGHEIVAAIALGELSPAARGQVAQLLGSETMLIHDANWADEIRDRHPEQRDWHFVDIPLNAPGYDAGRDCRDDDCVVAQIERDSHTLANHALPAAVRAEALRFLIHFVADVHQPLHAEDNGDRGGNAVHVYFHGQGTNLHHIWDDNVVDVLGSDTRTIAANISHAIGPAQRKAWEAGTPAEWANESHQVARDEIYSFVGGRHTLDISDQYLFAQRPITMVQLAKAGLRLAWLLNADLN